MTDQLQSDLRAALGDAYLIERELTGGGMSRVFVAREQALGRDVVIKVLPPELSAGINHRAKPTVTQLPCFLTQLGRIQFMTATQKFGISNAVIS